MHLYDSYMCILLYDMLTILNDLEIIVLTLIYYSFSYYTCHTMKNIRKNMYVVHLSIIFI